MKRQRLILALVSILATIATVWSQKEITIWHSVVLDFEGPETSEQAEVNPFTDYRLDVTFTRGSETFVVPGYYAADGNAAETSASSGNIWRVKFTPDAVGEWTYAVSFRSGKNIAVDLDLEVGKPCFADGATGRFTVLPSLSESNPKDFKTKGRLAYVGKHYLQFLGDENYFLKGGTDSPENLLAFADFDNTRPRMNFASHVADWTEDDPSWQNGKGKGLIGAINYLSSVDVNSLYFMPLTIGGDAKDTHPFASEAIDYKGSPSNDNLRYDVSKLAQWDIVFAHAQSKGLLLNAVLNEGEVENKKELDGAQLGPERKLFYRELVARFGYHNALQWNLCEEYNGGGDTGWLPLDPALILEWAAYLSAIDPYDHPMTVHNVDIDDFFGEDSYGPFLGSPLIDLTSMQAMQRHFRYGKLIEEGRALSTQAGRPWVISLDESKLFNTFSNRPDDQRFSTQNRARVARLSGPSTCRVAPATNGFPSNGPFKISASSRGSGATTESPGPSLRKTFPSGKWSRAMPSSETKPTSSAGPKPFSCQANSTLSTSPAPPIPANLT